MNKQYFSSRSNRRRVLFVSAEIFPLAKTGGLADVCGTLPRHLGESGDLDILLMLPAYESALSAMTSLRVMAELPDLPGGPGRLLRGTLPGVDLNVVLLDHPQSFRRPGGLYVDERGQEWADNAIRFAALSHAAVELAMGRAVPSWRADLVHCNDWHTGLVPLLLSSESGCVPRSILTVHNLAFQGIFPPDLLDLLGLPPASFAVEGCEYFGQISFLKAGIVFADKLTTVSPSYAEEIVSPEFGMGLDGVLAARRSDLIGILNGIDDQLWNPATDPALDRRYSALDTAGKTACKLSFQRDWGLDCDERAPLFVFAARLEDQKMADTLLEVMPDIVERRGTQIAILGKGARAIEEGLAAWPERAPGRVAVRIGYEEGLARQVLAAGDMLIHGARFEPCGLVPLYAMRYGSIPIVRAVGGLRDSVVGVSPETLLEGTATGFAFGDATGPAMLEAIDRALMLYERPDLWSRVRTAGMHSDFSWRRSAARYKTLYDELTCVGP